MNYYYLLLEKNKNMNTINELAAKRNYIQPLIERIVIDFEISLTTTSPGPKPDGPPLGSNDYFKNDPFKTNLA